VYCCIIIILPQTIHSYPCQSPYPCPDPHPQRRCLRTKCLHSCPCRSDLPICSYVRVDNWAGLHNLLRLDHPLWFYPCPTPPLAKYFHWLVGKQMIHPKLVSCLNSSWQRWVSYRLRSTSPRMDPKLPWKYHFT
jgi:hypothetical protein